MGEANRREPQTSLSRVLWIVVPILTALLLLPVVTHPQAPVPEGPWRLGLVADRDFHTKDHNRERWTTFFKEVSLSRGADGRGAYAVTLGRETKLHSTNSRQGRGLELSDLVMFGRHLLSFDDRTGLVYEILNRSVLIPRQILMDGNGVTDMPFKAEWSTVKDGKLYVGSMGKEWIEDGRILHNNPCWVKAMLPNWGVVHEDWSSVYSAMQIAAGYHHPGYLLHEAAHWFPDSRTWLFLPRRASADMYDPIVDEKRGTNLVFRLDENFRVVSLSTLGPLELTRGFSCFRPVPGHPHHIIAIKTEEVGSVIGSYLMGFDLNDGSYIINPIFLGNVKYEGLEFLP